MSRLHIVIGYPDSSPSSAPFPVYVGTSGDESRTAMAASTAARFVILANPLGIRKANAHAAANLAKRAEQAKPTPTAEVHPPNSFQRAPRTGPPGNR